MLPVVILVKAGFRFEDIVRSR